MLWLYTLFFIIIDELHNRELKMMRLITPSSTKMYSLYYL